ncbi:DUF2798 domain-containing protein [Comamonas sp.]|uniref:DUF2798 domain-containing protein n=1 Tax=Comamonas sp. TaxID=34028 RepID=UPI00289AD62F|nr:DUF2798 domain-containing protein [Comamonas sp.]
MSNALKQRLLSSVLMSLLLSGLMTAWVTWLNLGFVGDFIGRWLHAYLMSWPAAFTIVVLLGPTVQRLSWRWVGGSPVAASSPAPSKPVAAKKGKRGALQKAGA